jgi:hypothetical protein
MIENARYGKGPALIECMTYRWRGHVGPSDDLDKGLRSREELDCWMNRDPIKILENLLLDSFFKEKMNEPGGLFDLVIPIYDKYFTHSEIKGLLQHCKHCFWNIPTSGTALPILKSM